MNDTSVPPSVHDRAPRGAAGSRRHTAAGKKLNYALGFLAVIVLYVGYVLLTPRLTAYELKTAMRPICVTYMGAVMAKGMSSDRSLDWQRDFEARYRRLEIPLREDQWAFTASNPCTRQVCSCTAEAVFELATPWLYLEDFVEVAPYKSTHHVKVDVDWKSHY